MRILGRFIHGARAADPSSPEDGEVWHTSNRLRTRLAGVTRNLLSVRNDTGTVEDQITWSGAHTFNSIALFQSRLGIVATNVSGNAVLDNTSKTRQRYTGAGGHTVTLPDGISVGQRMQWIENDGTGPVTVVPAGTNTIMLQGTPGLTSVVLQPGELLLLMANGAVWDAHLLSEKEVVFSTSAPADTTALWIDTDDDGVVVAEGPVVSALPSNPFDGQVVRFQNAAMATQGVIWTFRYRAGSANAQKWEFVGGPSLAHRVGGGNHSAAGWGVTLQGGSPSVTIPLAGIYEFAFGANAQNNSSGNDCRGYLGIALNGAIQIGTAYSAGLVPNFGNTINFEYPDASWAAGGVLTLQAYSNGGINTLFYNAMIRIRPVRVA